MPPEELEVRHLPKPKDRPSLPAFFREMDVLVTDYGWKKTVVYHQPVLLDNGRFAKLPVYAYLSPVEGKAIHIISGVHGRLEEACPLAIAEEVGSLGKFGQRHPTVIIPILNYDGYVNNLRYPNIPGKHHNLTSVGDFDTYVLRDEQRIFVPRKQKPLLPYIDDIAEGLLAIFSTHPPEIELDYHKDYTGTLTHHFSSGPLRQHDPVAQLEARLTEEKLDIPLRYRHDKNSIGREEKGGTLNRGVVFIRWGDLEDFYAAHLIRNRQGIIIPGPKADVAIAIELPTHLGKRIYTREEQTTHQRILLNGDRLEEILEVHEKHKLEYVKARISLTSPNRPRMV